MTVENPEPEVDEALSVSLAYAAIGDVLLTGVDSPIPGDWHELDGSVLPSREWPDFVELHGIVGSTFELPKPDQMGNSAQRFVIKLGEHVPSEPVKTRPTPSYVADREKRTLVGTMMVRDEADIIAASLEHALDYLDHLIVVDNGSTDGTSDILADYAKTGRVSVSSDLRADKPQAEIVTTMARQAFTEHQAHWVINLDADEFLVAVDPAQTVREVLETTTLSQGSFLVPVTNLIGPPAKTGPGLERLTRRGDQPRPIVIHRGTSTVRVEQGNHATSLPVVGDIRNARLECLHLPYRSAAQYEAKVRNTGRAYVRAPANWSPAAKADYNRLLDGSLNDHYLAMSPLPSELEDHPLEERLDEAIHQVEPLVPDRLSAVLDAAEDLFSEADQQAAREREASR